VAAERSAALKRWRLRQKAARMTEKARDDAAGDDIAA
jgi:hypothetical protein